MASFRIMGRKATDSMNVEKFEVHAQLDKRTYLPGVVIESPCPECGKVSTRDMKHDYLSYPVTGEDSKVYMYCEDGHKEVNWEVKVVLRLYAEVHHEPPET